MELQNYSEVSYLNGIVSLKLGNTTYKLKFIQECETEDGEEPQFWQITLEGSNNMGVQMTPSQLPWSMAGNIEFRPLGLLRRPGIESWLVMDFAEAVIVGVGICLQLLAIEDDFPDWLAKVLLIIDALTDDFAGNTVPCSWLVRSSLIISSLKIGVN